MYLGEYRDLGLISRRLKYGGQRNLACALARPLALGVQQAGWGAVGVTAVPTSLPKRWLRGYNQAELLAKALAAELELPYRNLLRRPRYAPSQAKQQRHSRTILAPHTFVPVGQASGNWILVDDVFTSGATFRAARQALYGAGVAEVRGVFIAVSSPTVLRTFVL